MTTRYPWKWLPIFVFLSGCAAFEIAGEVQTGRRALLKGEPQTALTHFETAAQSNPNYVADFTHLPQSIWTYVGRAHYAAGELPKARQALEKARTHHKDDFLAKLYLGLTLIRQGGKTKTTLSLDDILYALREGVAPKRVAALIHQRGIGFELTREGERNLRNRGADDQLIEEIKTISAQSSGMSLRERGLKEVEAGLKQLRNWLDSITRTTLYGKFWDPGGEIRNKVQSALSQIAAEDIERERLLDDVEWIGKAIEEESDRAREDEKERRRRGFEISRSRYPYKKPLFESL